MKRNGSSSFSLLSKHGRGSNLYRGGCHFEKPSKIQALFMPGRLVACPVLANVIAECCQDARDGWMKRWIGGQKISLHEMFEPPFAHISIMLNLQNPHFLLEHNSHNFVLLYSLKGSCLIIYINFLSSADMCLPL